MCRFVVLDRKASGRLFTLLDSYGKCHVARLETGVSVAAGSELHGPRAALGLHFLVDAQSGRRLTVDFHALHVAQPERPGPRLPQPSPLQRPVADLARLQAQALPQGRQQAPANGMGQRQLAATDREAGPRQR